MKEKNVLQETITCFKEVTPEKFADQAKQKAPGLLITIAGECVMFGIKCFRDAAKEIAESK